MKKSIVTIIILFILLSVLNASDYDIKNLELKISNYIKAHSGKVVMKDIRVLKHLSILSNVVIENAELLKPKENSNLFFISGRGYINTSFFDLKNKKMDMVIEISSDVSNSSSKDLKYSIGWFFKKWDFLDRKNIKLKNTMFFWSNQANSYSKDDIPEKIRDKYSDLLKSTNNVIRLRKHGNIFGILNISYYKAFKFLKSLIPTLKNNYNMMLSGYITWPAREIELRAKLPSEVDFKLPKGMRANMPTFFITLPDIRRHNPFNIGRKMMMGIELQVDAKLPPHNTPMSFIGKISIPYKPSVNRGIKTALIASDKGKAWKDACNIKGLDIYELVFECELFPEDIVFGFRGKLDIGKKKIDVAATVPLDIEDLSKISFSAKLNKLSVADLFFFMKNNHPKGKKDEVLLALDKIEYKDVQMTFSAVNDRELNLSEGIALTATLNIYGKDIKRTELRTWKLKGYKNYIVDGYTEKACIGKIKLGAFELSGKGFDKKYGTKDDGPTYEFVLALTEQNFVISGITKLFDSLINLEVYLGLTGGYAKAKAKILENLDTKLEFKYNINWKAPYVQLTGSFDTDFSSYLSKKAREMIEKAKKNMDKKLNSAKDNVAKAKKKVDKLKPDYERAEKDFEKGKKKAEKKLDKAKRKVDSLKKDIKKAKDTYKHCKFSKKTYYWGKVKVLEASKKVADKALDIAKYAVKKSASPKYLAIKAAYNSAEFGLKEAKDTLSGIKTLVDDSTKFGEDLTCKTENMLVVKNAHFTLNYTDREYAKRTKMFIDGKLREADVKVKDFLFDMNKFKDSSIKFIKEIFKKAGGRFHRALDYL